MEGSRAQRWQSYPVDELPDETPWMMTAATTALSFPRDGGLQKITGASCLGWLCCHLLPLGSAEHKLLEKQGGEGSLAWGSLHRNSRVKNKW